MLKEGTISRIESYVKNGGNFVATYLSGIVDKDDLCFLGGFPGNELKDVFGIWVEETDSLPEGMKNVVEYNGKEYDAINFCDILHSKGADVLATYKADFYSETPAVTEEQLASGEIAYLLNAHNEAPAWFQLIGTDPMPTRTGTAVVYQSGTYNCDGTPATELTYTNTETEPVHTPHNYDENGFCLRLLSDTEIAGGRQVKPNLEDVYLSYFGE